MGSSLTAPATRGFKYVYSGKLTRPVNDVAAAIKYLTEDEMVRYLDGLPTVLDLRWDLKQDGETYEVIALSSSELDDTEISDLTEFVKAQHSDGLGEGFEQQDFADHFYEMEAEEAERYGDGDDEFEQTERDYANAMSSFDWKTNTTMFVKVERF